MAEPCEDGVHCVGECGGCNISESTSCSTPVTICVLDGGECPGTLILTIDVPPTYGTAEVAGLNIIYTPCPDFIGIDYFTYQVNGGPASFRVTMTVGSAAEACRYYSVLRCNGAYPDQALYLEKALVCAREATHGSEGTVFKYTDNLCYKIDRSCPTCTVPPGATEVTAPDWVNDGCYGTTCYGCLGCGPYCFSDESKATIQFKLNSLPGHPCPLSAPIQGTITLPGVGGSAEVITYWHNYRFISTELELLAPTITRTCMADDEELIFSLACEIQLICYEETPIWTITFNWYTNTNPIPTPIIQHILGPLENQCEKYASLPDGQWVRITISNNRCCKCKEEGLPCSQIPASAGDSCGEGGESNDCAGGEGIQCGESLP